MVRAAVSERKLVRLVPCGKREQLMAEADAEDRDAADQLAHDGDLVCKWLGITGAVRKQYAVEAQELVHRSVVRKDGDRCAGAREPPQDRTLAPVVDDSDASATRVGVRVRLRGGHGGCERAAGHRRLCAGNLDCLLDRPVTGDCNGAQGAAVAQLEDERARVDPAQRDDAAFVEPVRPGRPARLAHQHRSRVCSGRFGATLGNAVVPDHRRREADELFGEARVGDDLLVAGHGGGEHRFAHRKAVGRDRVASEHRAVLQCEEACHALYTSLPAAIVTRTLPLTAAPSSHEFTDLERNVSSVMR